MIKHLSDETILLLMDGELSRSEAAFAETHLDGCPDCQTRQIQMEEYVADLVAFGRSSIEEEGSFDPAPRALLKQRMQAETTLRPLWRGRLEMMLSGRRHYAVYASLLLTVFGMGLFLRQRSAIVPAAHSASVEAAGIPNRSLTPGVTRPVDLADICPIGDDDLDPAVPSSMQQVVFAEYGLAPENAARNYQVDYLINPQLGGTNDVRNLWPEPYTSTVWNARVKDALEDRLHEMVCARTLDLASAQRDIATDWISAYKKYFHTPKPV